MKGCFRILQIVLAFILCERRCVASNGFGIPLERFLSDGLGYTLGKDEFFFWRQVVMVF